MMIFSLVAMTGLEKCCITSAYLQWLCHSGERPVACGPLVKHLFIIQGIIQNMTCSVWFRIQRIIQIFPGYYSVSGSLIRVLLKIRPAASGLGFSVLFKIRPAASGSGFRVLLKNVQGIIQRMVHYSGYYSKYDLQRLVQDSGYYSKMSRVLFSV